MSTGWICPKCGKVYAPYVTECIACNGASIPVEPNPKWWLDWYPYYRYPYTNEPFWKDDEEIRYTC